MSSVNISSTMLYSQLVSSINKNGNDYSLEQLKIASGQKYIDQSEDPVATNEISRLTVDNEKLAQWQDNVSFATNWEKATASSLTSIMSQANSAYSLVSEMNGGILTSDDYTNFASEYNEIIEALVENGNAKYNGVELFAGVTTGSLPYTVTRNSSGDISSVSFLNGDTTTRRETSTSDGTITAYGTTGDSVFNFSYTYTDGTTRNVDLLSTLISIRDSLAGGSLPDDAVSADVQAAVNHISQVIVKNSSSQTKLAATATRLTSLTESATSRLSDVGDLDLADASTKLAQYQVALQASYQVLSAMNDKMTLLDYL